MGETVYVILTAPKGKSQKLSGKRTIFGRNSGEHIVGCTDEAISSNDKSFRYKRQRRTDFLSVCFFI